MCSIATRGREIALWFGILLCAGCPGQRRAANPIEGRVGTELLGRALNCQQAQDIRWAAEGSLLVCSFEDSSQTIVVVKRMRDDEVLQFAKRARFSSVDSVLSDSLAAMSARIAVAAGKPVADCAPATGRRLHWRRGALTVNLVLQLDQNTIDESWTVRESPVVSPCDLP